MLFDDDYDYPPPLLLLLDGAADGLVVVLPGRVVPGDGAAGDRVTAVAPHRRALGENLLTMPALAPISPRISAENLLDLFVSEPTR